MTLSDRTFELSDYVYATDAVTRAIEIFSGHCTVVVADVDHGIAVTVEPLPGAPTMITGEFLNYALNLSIEQHLSEA
jgi:hypothetical protein